MTLQFPKEKYQIHQFSNGLTLIYQHLAHLPVSHCGYFIPIGGRNEPDHLEGIAHFIEHCLFKGTQKRKSKQILSSIDGYGGELNAYTAKEETCLYCAIPSAYIAKALDVLTDVVFFSSFPSSEIEKEKKVILDEIQSYLDSPSELIFDDFESLIFQDHPLGKNILGTETSVQAITQKDVLEFVHNNYEISKMIFSYVGNISLEKIVALLEKNMLKIPLSYSQKKQELKTIYHIKNYQPKNASSSADACCRRWSKWWRNGVKSLRRAMPGPD
jgi:predicted Zn-dependent peptidase